MKDIDLSQYHQIDTQRLVPQLREDPIWYKSGPVAEAIDELMPDSVNKSKRAARGEFVKLVGTLLRRREVLLGDRPEGFNDDDRWGSRFNPRSAYPPDVVVIHHTHTTGSFESIDALGLLRLYVPIYRATQRTIEQGGFGIDMPISSGHFLGNRQVFVGYHDLIWPNGKRTRALDPDYTGLHSGDYELSCRSYGIALVGSFGERHPTDKALEATQLAIAEYNPLEIIGHREVISPRTGVPVQTECPGATYYGPTGWGKKLAVVS